MFVTEIDWRPILDAFAPLARTPYAALLHAGEAASAPGWSVIAAFPSMRLEVRGGVAFIDGARTDAPPFDALRRLAVSRTHSGRGPLRAPFQSGLCGFVGYEMGAALEPTAAGPVSPFALPDMAFGAYDALALFDRETRRAFISSRSAGPASRLAEALGACAPAAPPRPTWLDCASNVTADAYRQRVADVLEKIRDGALFQANLSQRFTLASARALDPLDLFRLLAGGDAPFAACLSYPEGAIVSNSPERFFRIDRDDNGARLVAEPIKGTRPRSVEPATDAMLAAALLADPKDRAENIMIADLTRNDLSRICRDGSIREEAICELSSFAGVHHLVSRISGRPRENAGAVEALEALLPCGSITGAPKIEAMKTIAAAEGAGRGPYCGAIGYIDDRGGADFSVAIRTLVVEGARASLSVGGGITLRSDPDAEYLETLDKAAAILSALGAWAEAAA